MSFVEFLSLGKESAAKISTSICFWYTLIGWILFIVWIRFHFLFFYCNFKVLVILSCLVIFIIILKYIDIVFSDYILF